MDRLQISIAHLYAAFADVPQPSHIDGCPCCIKAKHVETLIAKELTEISAQEMAAYAASAFLTVGDVADYLYFLPRILEISATDDSWWPHPEVTGRAIRSSKLEEWVPKRHKALTDFLEAVIATAIERGEYFKIDSWMCAIGRMGLDVRPYLEMIGESPQAVLGYFGDTARSLPEGLLCNPFWDLPCEGHNFIVKWFQSDEIRQVLHSFSE